MDTTAVDVPDLLTRHAIAESERPVLTYYDDATGERTELSGSALSGWAARTAGLLRDGCGLGTGSRAAVLLPPHWQTAAVLLGAWSAGLSVSFRLWATAGLAADGADQPYDACFVSRTRVDSWLEDVPKARHRFVLGLEPDGAPLSEVPDGYRDYVAEVRARSDSLVVHQPVLPTDAATVDGTSYRDWGAVAAGVAEIQDLYLGDRVLVDVARTEHPAIWLLAPLAAGASVVLCNNLDPATVSAKVAAEGVTRVL